MSEADKLDPAEADTCVRTGWLPIRTAPKDGRKVLLFSPQHVIAPDRIMAGEWAVYDNPRKEGWEVGHNELFGGIKIIHFLPFAPSHWMPLPCEPVAA